jgi:hypothetical protein
LQGPPKFTQIDFWFQKYAIWQHCFGVAAICKTTKHCCSGINVIIFEILFAKTIREKMAVFVFKKTDL